MNEVIVQVRENGPYLVTGDIRWSISKDASSSAHREPLLPSAAAATRRTSRSATALTRSSASNQTIQLRARP